MAGLLRRYFVIPVGLCGLSIVFIIFCIILRISKKNDAILRKKLRIGGLILALQAVAIQGAWAGATCYERKTPEFAVSDSVSESDVLEVNLKETSEILAMIKYGERRYFSFAIVRKDSVIQSGAVNPFDGRMDSLDEKVTIPVDPNKVSIGTYELRVFWGAMQGKAGIFRASPLKTYKLIVRSE
jgi:hypothetical protein